MLHPAPLVSIIIYRTYSPTTRKSFTFPPNLCHRTSKLQKLIWQWIDRCYVTMKAITRPPYMENDGCRRYKNGIIASADYLQNLFRLFGNHSQNQIHTTHNGPVPIPPRVLTLLYPNPHLSADNTDHAEILHCSMGNSVSSTSQPTTTCKMQHRNCIMPITNETSKSRRGHRTKNEKLWNTGPRRSVETNCIHANISIGARYDRQNAQMPNAENTIMNLWYAEWRTNGVLLNGQANC